MPGWETIQPVFTTKIRETRPPEKPSDAAIKLAQMSYDGQQVEGSDEVLHVMQHRFGSVEEAAQFADEVKRAGYFVKPDQSTVTVVIDPEHKDDKRVVRWSAGGKRGRK